MRYPLKNKVVKWLVGFMFLLIHLSTYSLIHCLYASGTGTTAGTTMLSAVGVRQMALGNSGSALVGDAYAMFYNPALLAEISQKQLSTFFATGLSDDYKASVVYGLPVPSSKKGGLAFGVFHLNGGKMEINDVNGTSKNVTAQSDFLAMLGWGGYWSKNASVGYNLKYLSTKLVEDYPASAIAFDMGIQLNITRSVTPNSFRGLVFGLSGQNYGTSLKYRSQAESLPFLIRSGFSYWLPFSKHYSLLAVIDGFYIMKEKDFYSSAGLEYSISEKYFLRGGIKIMPERYEFTLGAGFKFSERYSIDWATELSELNNPHNVAFSMRFGGTQEDKVRKKEEEGKEKEREEKEKLKRLKAEKRRIKIEQEKKEAEEKEKQKILKSVQPKIIQPSTPKPIVITNLAVADFVGKNVSAADASIVADFLRTEFVHLGRYNVVEKANMDRILAEAAFQQTGSTGAEYAVQIGKILNVQQMVVGSLSKLTDTYYITANLVEVETGKILKSERIETFSSKELSYICKILADKLTK